MPNITDKMISEIIGALEWQLIVARSEIQELKDELSKLKAEDDETPKLKAVEKSDG